MPPWPCCLAPCQPPSLWSISGAPRRALFPSPLPHALPPWNPNPKTWNRAPARRHCCRGRRRLRPPGAKPLPPPAPPRAPLPPRQANRAGGARIRRNRHRHSASGRRRRAPSRRRRPSSGPTDHALALVVSSRSIWTTPPSLSPSEPHSPRAPPPAAATMVAGATPATIWSVAPPPGSSPLPRASSACPRVQFRSRTTN